MRKCFGTKEFNPKTIICSHCEDFEGCKKAAMKKYRWMKWRLIR
jgi:ribosomal protein L37E